MPPKPDPLKGFRTDLSVGDILKRARLKKNLSLPELEEAIRVSVAHLMAIEQNQLDALPGRIYALGFIKAYAEHVDLDSRKVIELLKRQAGEKITKKIAPQMPPVMDDFSLPSRSIFILIILLFIVTFVAKSIYLDPRTMLEDEIPKVPQDLVVQTTLVSKPEKTETVVQPEKERVTVESLQELLPPPPSDQIVLRAVENVWLEIRDATKKTIFSRVLSVGEEYWIPVDQKDLTMTLGNAGGLQILIDNQPLPFLGRTGQVIRKVDLNPEKLKQNLKIAPKPAM